MSVQVLVRILVSVFMRVVMVLVFSQAVNGPGVCRRREIKERKSQQDECENSFHNVFRVDATDSIEPAAGCKEFFGPANFRRSHPKKDCLSLMASWRKF
jgi:hypothetical protein